MAPSDHDTPPGPPVYHSPATAARPLFQQSLKALREGVPQVLVPLGADQPFNAERAAAGAARVLPADGLTPEAVRAAVDATLREPSYRESAQRPRAEMEALPGVEHGVHLLERLTRQPLARAGEDVR